MTDELSNISRRDFTKLSTLALAALPVMGFENALNGHPYSQGANELKVYLFSIFITIGQVINKR